MILLIYNILLSYTVVILTSCLIFIIDMRRREDITLQELCELIFLSIVWPVGLTLFLISKIKFNSIVLRRFQAKASRWDS